ncbi:hypothetical protein ACFST9_22060 [Hymenobacter monticola]
MDRLEIMLKPAHEVFAPMPVNFNAISRLTALPSYNVNGVALEIASKCENSNYHVAYNIIIDKQRFGTLLLDRTKFYHCDNNLFKLQLTNHTCYTAWLPKLHLFLTSFHLEVNNITALEISMDTNTDILSDFFHYFNQPDVFHLVSGLKPASNIERYGELYRDGSTVDTFYLGKTSKKVKIYNKSLDIVKKGKHYITDYHKANGLDIDSQIFRLELALTNNALKRSTTVYKHKYNGEELSVYQYEKLSNKGEPKTSQYNKHTRKTSINITIDDLADSNKLSGLLELLMPTVLQFKIMDNKRISRCTDVQFVKFKTLSNIQYIHTTDKTKNRDTNMNKNAIHQNLKCFVKTKAPEMQKAALRLATDANLVEYYDQLLKQLHIESKPVAPIFKHSLSF